MQHDLKGVARLGHGGTAVTLERNDTGKGDGGNLAVWSLRVCLDDDGLTAETVVLLGPDSVEISLADFFAEMARDWRGWGGAREWVGMEGGLSLSATHDGLGHVAVEVAVRQRSGDGWLAQTAIQLDAGELDAVVEALRAVLTVEARD